MTTLEINRKQYDELVASGETRDTMYEFGEPPIPGVIVYNRDRSGVHTFRADDGREWECRLIVDMGGQPWRR